MFMYLLQHPVYYTLCLRLRHVSKVLKLCLRLANRVFNTVFTSTFFILITVCVWCASIFSHVSGGLSHIIMYMFTTYIFIID